MCRPEVQHCCFQFNFSLSSNHWKPSDFLRGRKMWNSVGAKYAKYRRYSKIFHLNTAKLFALCKLQSVHTIVMKVNGSLYQHIPRFYLSQDVKLGFQRFEKNEELKTTVLNRPSQAADFYTEGTKKLRRYKKYLEKNQWLCRKAK